MEKVAIQADMLKPVYARYPELDKFGYRRSQSRDNWQVISRIS